VNQQLGTVGGQELRNQNCVWNWMYM